MRNDEITKDFLKLADAHLDDLKHGRAQKRFHTKDFAAQLFVAPGHLSNTLLQMMGKSVCDFMEENIIVEAKRLLKETDMPVAEIGYQFLYNDASNFTKFFKGYCGVTPLQYRRQNQDYQD